MQLTPKELQSIATNRYWKTKHKAILIGFLIIINIIGLVFLGLFIRGDLPIKTLPQEYSLNETIVTLQGNLVFLNGLEMQRTDTLSQGIGLAPIALLFVALVFGYWFYHSTKAKQYGRDLLEESINKEKASGQ